MSNSNSIIASASENKSDMAMSKPIHSPAYYPPNTPEWKDRADYNSDEYLDLEPSTEDEYSDLEEPEEEQPEVGSPETQSSEPEVTSLKQKQPEEPLVKDIPSSSSETTFCENTIFYIGNQPADLLNFKSNLKSLLESCQIGKVHDKELREQYVRDSVSKALDGTILRKQEVMVGPEAEIKIHGNTKKRKGKSSNKRPAKKTAGGYKGKHPLCTRCERHHPGRCSVVCQRCMIIGHMAKNCRVPTSATKSNTTTPRTCYKCGEVGHYRSSCPNKKTKKLPPGPN